jgi:hypothetical protein
MSLRAAAAAAVGIAVGVGLGMRQAHALEFGVPLTEPQGSWSLTSSWSGVRLCLPVTRPRDPVTYPYVDLATYHAATSMTVPLYASDVTLNATFVCGTLPPLRPSYTWTVVGTQYRTLCEPGSYRPIDAYANLAVCVACAANTYSTGFDAPTCDVCPAGYSSEPKSTACVEGLRGPTRGGSNSNGGVDDPFMYGDAAPPQLLPPPSPSPSLSPSSPSPPPLSPSPSPPPSPAPQSPTPTPPLDTAPIGGPEPHKGVDEDSDDGASTIFIWLILMVCCVVCAFRYRFPSTSAYYGEGSYRGDARTSV